MSRGRPGRPGRVGLARGCHRHADDGLDPGALLGLLALALGRRWGVRDVGQHVVLVGQAGTFVVLRALALWLVFGAPLAAHAHGLALALLGLDDRDLELAGLAVASLRQLGALVLA